MKKILFVSAVLAAVMSCQKYEYNTEFSAPTQLDSPSEVVIDLAGENIVLAWTGGGAEDGGVCLYNVLFDRTDGDFREPLSSMQSDNGGLQQLTITQAQLNNIARASGIAPLGTGEIKWTVTASRGGEVKRSAESATIVLTRPDGIDNIPEHLYLDGTGAATDGAGREFRIMDEGVFRIYTVLDGGAISFRSSMDSDALLFYYDESTASLREGEGETSVSATENDKLVRITVNFNARTMVIQTVDKTVYYVLGINGDVYVELAYDGSGEFSYTGELPFYLNYWGSGLHEERYYFKVDIDESVTYWGRGAGISAEQPSADESIDFYVLHEYTDFSQMWDFAWKAKWDYLSISSTIRAKVTIVTNSDNLMIHTFEFAD